MKTKNDAPILYGPDNEPKLPLRDWLQCDAALAQVERMYGMVVRFGVGGQNVYPPRHRDLWADNR